MDKKKWISLLICVLINLAYTIIITIKYFNMYDPLLYLSWGPAALVVLCVLRIKFNMGIQSEEFKWKKKK